MDKHRQSMDEAHPHEAPAPIPVIPPGSVGFERTDANAKSILRIGIVLTLVTLAAAGVAFGLFRLLAAREERNDPPRPPLARAEGGRLPPEPRLQTAPPAELAAVQDADRLALAGYGWVDEGRGVAHIPIEEAMALYVEQSSHPAATPASPPPAASAVPPASPQPEHR